MRFFLMIVACCCFLGASAQSHTGTVSGHITDAANKAPVPYATVVVADKSTGKTVNGAVADDKGNFSVKGLTPGMFTVSIEFIGYNKKLIDSIKITNTNTAVNLGTISIQSSAKSLGEVVVTSKAPIVESKVDRVVYNAANDLTSQGGVALDVLRKVPQVTVDVDGNVELQGNSNIRFLINGKPSSMFGNNLADALAAIPASQIQSIEAITSPGAKYDAQGTGGIINIVLKENRLQGMNGSINLAAGTRLENAAVNLNLRHNNFGVNLFFNGNAQLSSSTPSSQDRSSFTDGKLASRLWQSGTNDLTRRSYATGLGFDWSPSKKDNFSAGVSFNHFSSQLEGTSLLRQWTAGSNDTSTISRPNSSRNWIDAMDWNLGYKRKFNKPGQELDFLYSASFGSPYARYYQLQYLDDATLPFGGTQGYNPGSDHQHNLSLDYTQPVSKSFTLEAGVKAIFHDLQNSSQVNAYDKTTDNYHPDPTQSYDFNYRMNIYAGYLSASFNLFQFLDVVAGARYEYTSVAMNYPGGTVPSYGNFVPSLIFSHKFDDDNMLKLAYTHRLERPDRELNPFLNLSDPYNITTGNPLLKPEIGDNFELGYSRSFKGGGNIYIALMERINSNDIKPYTAFYPTYTIGDSIYTNVSVTSRVNIGKEYNSGLIITSSMPLTKNLNLRENLQVFNRHVVNELDGGNRTDGINWRLNMNASYQLPKNLIAEVFGEFRSAFNNIQGRQPQNLSYTIALRKQFWNKKAALGITATNPFSQYISQVTTIHTAAYSSYLLREIPYRSFGINFSYKFGKLQFKKEKESDNNYLNNLPSF
ncbi:TonB-dependent receptor domain-containing protein [Chitinophaga sp. Hz27]|uniref:TonB-dependent receptor domain-containing protein n=1 Tax=Chitinophaga sp. Hz27 TaxID=3347169 RepID=UPI0035DE22BB